MRKWSHENRPRQPFRREFACLDPILLAVEEIRGGDGFRLEAESFATLVRTGAGWTGATEAESIDTALALEAIAASLRAGGTWVDIPT